MKTDLIISMHRTGHHAVAIWLLHQKQGITDFSITTLTSWLFAVGDGSELFMYANNPLKTGPNEHPDKPKLPLIINDIQPEGLIVSHEQDTIQDSLEKSGQSPYSFNNIEQGNNSVSETFILSAGSDYLKNEINCNLNGEYSSAFINGVFSLKENQQHEIRTTINHLVENTKSYQLIKSVLGKNAKSAYQGKIFVNSKAQKTDGYQLSKAILLDETSEFNAKPELEIYADDVKCSHGSASGSLDENSIFYLMSRGLNYQQSKELLINGFLMDVVEKITDVEIKNLITNIIGLKQ